jgi:hypothetical protein
VREAVTIFRAIKHIVSLLFVNIITAC